MYFVKKFRSILCVFIVCICVSGCQYSAYKKYYTDINEYSTIWSLTGFRHGYDQQSPLFPGAIDDLQIIRFYCRYDEQLPLGEGVQLFIKVMYDEASFAEELQRILTVANRDETNFTSSQWSAYAVRLGEDGCWEYALADEKLNEVYYCFIYNLPQSEIQAEDAVLPDNYADYIRE